MSVATLVKDPEFLALPRLGRLATLTSYLEAHDPSWRTSGLAERKRMLDDLLRPTEQMLTERAGPMTATVLEAGRRETFTHMTRKQIDALVAKLHGGSARLESAEGSAKHLRRLRPFAG